ncbi:MAG: NAD-dependent epimerase [Spirochaetales bacterium]|nr:NAD-dependent epimerase [Spirochaetales bacterium]
MKILVTGMAGFIGFHTAKRLVSDGHQVIGLDNINDYYDVELKFGRLLDLGFAGNTFEYGKLISCAPGTSFIKLNLEDGEALLELFKKEKFDGVIHLAAQAGVRYSIKNPLAYAESNVKGTLNILEACRHSGTNNLVFASSSSVYGLNKKQPFKESHTAAHQVSLYAASKRSCEAMAHSYSHLYGISITGLRFFTVYGPWGRPDMSPVLFASAIEEDRPIQVFNNGDMARDFTYVEDVVEGIVRIIQSPPKKDSSWDPEKPDPSSSSAPYRIYNIGNGAPVRLMDFIGTIEKAMGKEAKKEFRPMQPGDVQTTWADTTLLERDYGYKPQVSIEEGIGKFVDWYKSYIK